MFVVLFALWVVFNGKLNAEIAVFGAVLSALIYLFSCRFLGWSPKKDERLLRLLPRAVGYMGLLLGEIVKSNLALLRLVYSPRIEVKPRLVTFRTPLKGAYRSVLADSITVTPGTITVHCQGERLTVHALDERFAQGVEDTAFQQRLLAMQEGEERA